MNFFIILIRELGDASTILLFTVHMGKYNFIVHSSYRETEVGTILLVISHIGEMNFVVHNFQVELVSVLYNYTSSGIHIVTSPMIAIT